MWLVNIFPGFAACFFILFTASFPQQEFTIMIKFNLLILFSCVDHVFGAVAKNSSLILMS